MNKMLTEVLRNKLQKHNVRHVEIVDNKNKDKEWKYNRQKEV